MVDHIGRKQADNATSGAAGGAPLDCPEWEALLVDKMDGTLTPEAEEAFAEHSLRCPGCAELLEEARQGQQWLKLLEARAPAAPVDLLSRILAKTQGAGRETDFPLGTGGSAILHGHAGKWGIPFLPPAGAMPARGAHNARMLMTAGMAFFSVALTLSVAGFRLTSVHAAELRPQAVQANVTRSFYGTKKQVVSFYENLRLVYEVESKMHEFRQDSEQTPVRQGSGPGGSRTAPKAAPDAHPSSSGHATSSNGRRETEGDSKHPQQVEQVMHGWPVSVNFDGALPGSPLKSACRLGRAQEIEKQALTTTSGGVTSKERNRI